MFITWRTYTATAGFSTQLEYVCALCGTRATAMVEAQGVGTSTAVYGAGGGGAQAQDAAAYTARANAIGALQHAPCPHCGGYQPIVTTRFAQYAERVAKTKKRSLPIAAIAAGLLLVIGVVPALMDLKHSSALIVTVVTGAIATFALLYAILSQAGPRPGFPFGFVHFWWGRPDGSVGWMPPPPVPPPTLPPPSPAGVVGGVGTAIFGLASFVAFLVWTSTYERVYIVDDGKTPIIADGVDVTNKATTSSFEDSGIRRIEVRSGSQQHRVDIGGKSYVLPTNAAYGWLIAPNAKARDICFAEMEMVYGGSSRVEPAYNPLEPNKDDILVLPRSYDDPFKNSPKTQEVKSGETVRRWSIRTVRCGASEPGQPTDPHDSGDQL